MFDFRKIGGLFVFLLVAVFSDFAYAQKEEPTNGDAFIAEMFKMHMGKTVCPPVVDMSFAGVRKNIRDYLVRKGLADRSTGEDVAKAIWEIYPCPFSPVRPELKLAGRNEILGIWVFPEGSQKLRYGPKSGQPSPAGPLPVKCEMVAYLLEGESRSAIIAGVPDCPFKSSKDIESIRKFPRVTSWSILENGRINIDRSDVENHVEEWDIYVVQRDFNVYSVDFSVGDLVAYLRKSPGNNVGASGQFRHLKKLSDI
jgi:hypothetical protein